MHTTDDARLISHEVLGDLFAHHIAVCSFEDRGIVIWEADCVLLAAFIDEHDRASEDTVQIVWHAGDMRKAADALERTGKKYVIWQRELTRHHSSRWRKLTIDKAKRLAYSQTHGRALV